MHRIIAFIADLLFPESVLEKQAKEVVAGIAKIKCDAGDLRTTYPCPAYSFFNYRNFAVRSLIWRLKYRGDISAAVLFAEKMYDQLCEELTELTLWQNFTCPLLIPIPISKHKLRTRGFNQTVAICKALLAADKNRFLEYIPDVLYKIKDTKSQARLKDKSERLKNLKDSFAVKDGGLIKNRNIILLDDVLTTGATLTEATRTLQNHNPRSVIWVTVAH